MTRRYFAVAASVLAGCIGVAAWTTPRVAPGPVQNSAATTGNASEAAPTAVERAPYDPQEAIQTVAFWQGRAREDPQGAVSLGNLAGAYLALQRESGDISYAIKAERAARQSLKLLPGHANTRHRLSRILLTQHRFGEALAVLKKSGARDADAQRLKVDVFIELGDYDAAQYALGLSPAQREDPNYHSLRARLLELRGRTSLSLQALRLATAQAEANPDAPAESVAWYYVREARGLALSGRTDEARRKLERALQIFPRDYRAMSALAHLAANEHKWKQALQWGSRAAAIVPEPDTVALMGDAHAAMGDQAKAKQRFQLVEAMGRLARSQGATEDRQRALFLADRGRGLDEALALARGELKLRRDIYTYDTLSWASYKKGLLGEARAASRRALALNTQDAMLWYHGGVIASAQGDRAEAKRLLEHALKINPRFHPSAPAHTRSLLAQLGASPTAR